MGRVILGGIVGGVLLFVWGYLSHMQLPIWDDTVGAVKAEDDVLGAMKAAIPTSGIYDLPGAEKGHQLPAEEFEALKAKRRAGPHAFVVFHPEGAETISPRQLGLEAASNILGALLAAVAVFALRAGFIGRLLMTTLFGIMGWLSISFSYWNWYGFSLEFTKAELIDQACGWLIVGIAIAIIVRPKAGPSAPPDGA